MALRSKLFQGDRKLEAAAVSDPDHVVPGSVGPHVAKIQTALIQLDGASIAEEELQEQRYAASTAAAVLSYKRKRNIVNRAYQTQADNIVGKMTIASLDKEMLLREITPIGPTRVLPIRPLPRSRDFLLDREAFLRPQPRGGLSGQLVSGTGIALPVAAPPGRSIPRIQLKTGQLGQIQVINGIGKRIVCRQSINGLIFDPNKPENHQAGSVTVTQNPQVLNIRARDPGRTDIILFGDISNPAGEVVMVLSVLPNLFTEIKTFFHFIDGPRGVKTSRSPADIDSILATMNKIYQDQASMSFVNSGVEANLNIASLGRQVPGVRVSQFGSTDDTVAIKARRKADMLFNVFFLGDFITPPNVDDGTSPNFLALTSRPPNDDKPLRCCLCRDGRKDDPPVIDPGKTLAHEAGHALGEDDDNQFTESLMFFSQSGQTDTIITPLMAQRMLASFKSFPP